MKRTGVMALILVANLVLLSTLFQHLRIFHIIPNTTMALVVSYALLRGSAGGGRLGFCAGLMQDLLFGPSIGFYALLYLLCGLFCGRRSRDFYRENYLLPVLFTALCTLFCGLAVYVTGFLFRGHYNPLPYLTGTILPETVYTGLVCPFLYRLLFSVNDALERGESHKRKLF